MAWIRLGLEYAFGSVLHTLMEKEMPEGTPISCREDMGLLAQIIKDSNGDHLEIGSAAGGSAIVAAKTMEQYNKDGKVVCIEPHCNERTGETYEGDKDAFWKNAEHFGVADRIEMVKGFSHPFPRKLEGRRFATAFIDGDHSYEYVKNDWRNTKEVVDEYIMFHDYVKPSVRAVVIHAAQDEDWILVAVHGWSAVLWKSNQKN